jgi:hypothetical protein
MSLNERRANSRAALRTPDRPVVAGIPISNPDRVVYPKLGVTKFEVAEFYESIGEWIVPHVEGRPLTLVLCPKGMSAECLFLKHSKVWGPKVIRRIRIQEKKKVGEYMIADSVSAVVALAQMGVLEIHTWNTTAEKILEMPPASYGINDQSSLPALATQISPPRRWSFNLVWLDWPPNWWSNHASAVFLGNR